jgi:hypothetical protein
LEEYLSLLQSAVTQKLSPSLLEVEMALFENAPKSLSGSNPERSARDKSIAV